jgi:large subunit ribosomal protein L5
MTDLAEKYHSVVVPALQSRFNYSSCMQVPKLSKIVLNMGIAEAASNNKIVQFAEYSLSQISGQKPVATRAKKSVAAFKLREGQIIGCMVTLRKRRMFDFLERLFYVALPRVRDFRGIPRRGFDGNGNFTMGLKEQIVFPEIEIDKLDKVRGFDITFVTTARTDEEGRVLLEELGLPFRKSSAA